MKALIGLLLLVGSASCYADNECSDPNPYLQQTCENLKRTSDQVQKTREEETKKETAKQEELIRKKIEEENKPPAPPPPKIPEWQKALKPPTPAQNQNNAASAKAEENKTDDTTAPLTPVPPLEPAEFANPKAVTLPGAVNVIPTNPEKSKGSIKYY